MRPRIVALILAAVMLLTASTTMAAWEDDFSGDLSAWYEFPSVPESDTFAAQILTSDVLELADSTAPLAGGAGFAYGYVNEPFGDTLVYGTLNPNGDSDMNAMLGLFLRADGDNAYVLGVDYSTGGIAIIKNSDEGQSAIGTPGSVSDFGSDNSLYVEFSAVGASLVGNVYTAPGGAFRGSASATDGDFAAGVAGVAVQYGNPSLGIRGTFDNVGATPEPGSLVLLGSGALCALGFWWRKRRRGKG
jgi:hypothetical protein